MPPPAETPTHNHTVNLLVRLFRAFPPKESIFKEPDPRPDLEFNQEQAIPFARWFGRGPELFSGKDVLDVGSGYGGRAAKYAEYGARTVVGIEITHEQVVHGARFARQRGASNIQFVLALGENLPLKARSFDLITMYDVMEHVIDPDAVMRECFRVLRPGGWLATVFPPYYALLSGPHLRGYATSLPGMNLFFSTESLRTAAQISMEERGIDYRRYLRDVPSDKLFNMNGLTVRKFQRLVDQAGFKRVQVDYMGEFFDTRLGEPESRLRRSILRPVSGLSQLSAQVPLLREALCSRICAILERPQN